METPEVEKKYSTVELEKETPLMKQYAEVKSKYPDALLLFRIGDFYETFGEDAVKTAGALGIVLTNRNNGSARTELAGFPYHSLDMYLPKLVKAGFRVAICEQLEKPSKEKKIVKRGVTELVTPGTATDEKILNHKSNHYLASLNFGNSTNQYGMAFLDLSTGEFFIAEGDQAYVEKLMESFSPGEIIFPKSKTKNYDDLFAEKYYHFRIDDWFYEATTTRQRLLDHFQVQNLKGFGVDDLTLGQSAAGAILQYLSNNEKHNIGHITQISRITREEHLWLDKFTVRNLELVNPLHDQGVSLLDILDQTTTPMGARMLRKWILLPLLSPDLIRQRLDIVSYFYEDISITSQLIDCFKSIGDLERLIGKIPLGKANPREVIQLKRALESASDIKKILKESGNPTLIKIGNEIPDSPSLVESIKNTVQEDAPVQIQKGQVIAHGKDAELDELRHIIGHSKEILISIQQKEIQNTGITNLKIGFNHVFGYYLEVTNKHKDTEVPNNWIRKQTLANAERYITEELKILEEKILGAEEKIYQLEVQLFEKLIFEILGFIQEVQKLAYYVAKLDVLVSFAIQAKKSNYCKPVIDLSSELNIKQGRHPVIEKRLPLGESYVPNDVNLNEIDQQILMITGPNMAGKSAFLRQTALIVLMAQIGSYVPAQEAHIGIIDKIFTRVGASDNLSTGESTFMVEMTEAASILNNLSTRSLVVLDEIGRGTSTYDGISIAWSIAEFLHEHPQFKSKTLFATHYHELNGLANHFPRIKNFHVAVKEIGNKIIFLRILTAGGSQHSFGIQVAKMAGMPKVVVDRATNVLQTMELNSIENIGITEGPTHQRIELTMPAPSQLAIFDSSEGIDPRAKKIMDSLKTIDLNTLTPIDALMKINEWKGKLNK
jgi:DNA mismatch repair protein MutS